jgi:hypothetical protein
MVGFLGGLAQGAAGLPDEIGQLIALKKLNQAKAANFNALTAQGGGAPAPQAAPPPPAAALAAIGKQPMAAGPQPAPQRDPLAPLPAAQPAPAPPPGQSQGTGGAEDPTGMSADPRVTDPWKEGQSILTNMAQSLKRANPKADPRTLADALEMQIEEVKGITPTTKAYMGAQVGMLKQQADLQFKMSKLQSENDYHMKYLLQKGLTAQQVEAERERHDRAVESIWSDREDAYQQSVDYQHEDRQSAEAGRNTRNAANIGSRENIAAGRNATQEDIAGRRSRDSKYRADQGFRGAQARSGIPVDPAPDAGDTGGGIPANVQQFAKQHGLTIIRRRADGKYDAKDKNGTVGVIG